MSRYKSMFKNLKQKQEGAFIPFWVLGYPNIETSIEVIETLIAEGADALELGIPFSDPIADGPVIQNASRKALENGITTTEAFAIISRIRKSHPHIPIGLLLYANLVLGVDEAKFYADAHKAGVDSILIADIPLKEISPLLDVAKQSAIEQVMILPPNANASTVKQVAETSKGYVYLLSRAGVTGAETSAHMPLDKHIEGLENHNAAPSILGFGISTPEHVANALNAGVAGVVCGSKVIDIFNDDKSAFSQFLRDMKQATIKAKV